MKKNKYLKLLASVLIIGFMTALTPLNPAQAAQSGDFTYVIYNGEVKITKYTGSGGNVVIPDYIGGYPVTVIDENAFELRYDEMSVVLPKMLKRIEDYAFNYCARLTSISKIPQTVTYIGQGAFSSCFRLTEINVDINNLNYSSQDGVLYNKSKTILLQCPSGKSGNYTIPNSVKNIEEMSFFSCENLSSIIIPNGVTTIGNLAFDRCIQITNINIPESVTSIINTPFGECPKLTQINVNKDNKYYSSLDGVLFDKAKTSIIRYPEGKSGDYVVPNSIKTIYSCAFRLCEGLTSITLNVTTIENGAFEFCKSLKNVNFGTNVTTIENCAFLGCENLNNIILPNKLKSIDGNAFEGCKNMTDIAIPSNVIYIGDFAFSGCTSLTKVTIPKSVIKIDIGAFCGCTDLTQIIVAKENINYCSKDGVLFNKELTSIINYPAAKSGEKYSIPETVNYIDEFAFYNALNLADIIIPDSVKKIGNFAFEYCKKLTNVTLPNSISCISFEVFAGCENLKTVKIGNGVTMIQQGAFMDCKLLNNVTFPDKVIQIDDSAFTGCKNLNAAIFLGNAPKLGSRVFENCASKFKIYYRSNKSGFTSPTWNGYPTVIIKVPSAPKVTATVGDGQVTLKWNAVAGATKYRVSRYDPSTKKYNLLNSNVTATNYTITGLKNGTTYTYLVRAYNGAVWSDFSAADRVSARPIAAPKPTATAGDEKITLKWSSITGATNYRIFLYDPATKKYTLIANTSNLNYTKTGLTNGKTYTFLVRAYNGVSWSAYSTVNHVCAMPIAAPKPTATAGDGKVTLKWSKVTGATSYRVYLYDPATKKYTVITNTSSLSYTKTGLTNGKNYIFLVRAYNGVSWSAYSSANHVSATPHK